MATKKTTKKDAVSDAQKVGIGVGLTAAVAAAAGAYFLYGSKSASKNRQAVKSWALKAKAEVLEKLEQAKEMTQEEYEAVVASVVGAYAGVQNITKTELKNFSGEMKDHWKAIEKATKPKKKTVKKAVKKAVSKATKKIEK